MLAKSKQTTKQYTSENGLLLLQYIYYLYNNGNDEATNWMQGKVARKGWGSRARVTNNIYLCATTVNSLIIKTTIAITTTASVTVTVTETTTITINIQTNSKQ